MCTLESLTSYVHKCRLLDIDQPTGTTSLGSNGHTIRSLSLFVRVWCTCFLLYGVCMILDACMARHGCNCFVLFFFDVNELCLCIRDQFILQINQRARLFHCLYPSHTKKINNDISLQINLIITNEQFLIIDGLSEMSY